RRGRQDPRGRRGPGPIGLRHRGGDASLPNADPVYGHRVSVRRIRRRPAIPGQHDRAGREQCDHGRPELDGGAEEGASTRGWDAPGSLRRARSIGGGGMGEVYKARDTRLDRITLYAVAPDSRFLALLRAGEETPTPLVVVQNWAEALKAK